MNSEEFRNWQELQELENRLTRLQVEMPHVLQQVHDLQKIVVQGHNGEPALTSRMSSLEAKQDQDLRNFEEYNKKLEMLKEEVKQMGESLKLWVTLSEVIQHTPGGLKTWVVGSAIAAVLAIAPDHFLNHFLKNGLYEGTPIESQVLK